MMMVMMTGGLGVDAQKSPLTWSITLSGFSVFLFFSVVARSGMVDVNLEDFPLARFSLFFSCKFSFSPLLLLLVFIP